MLTRRGVSLVELLVALTLAAIVLATATGSLLRQQRVTLAVATDGEKRAQLAAATALLPAQLGLNSSAAEDLVRGEQRDTALQLRTLVATGLACDSAAVVTFATDEDGVPSTGIASLPRASDSLWWYRADSLRWTGRLIVDARADSSACRMADVPGETAAYHRLLRVRVDGGDTIPGLSPLRISRQSRFVVYRAGDGSWQLGVREWSDATSSLAVPQPVAGPFARSAAGGLFTGFRYYDGSGAELHPDADPASGARVARIRLTVLTPPSVGGSTILRPPALDSIDVPLRSSSR